MVNNNNRPAHSILIFDCRGEREAFTARKRDSTGLQNHHYASLEANETTERGGELGTLEENKEGGDNGAFIVQRICPLIARDCFLIWKIYYLILKALCAPLNHFTLLNLV